jgi:hypothetical protein
VTASRGPSRATPGRALPVTLCAVGTVLVVAAFFVPLWEFSASLPNAQGGSESFEIITYLSGHYAHSSSANTTLAACPLTGGNYSKCASLNATARYYDVLEGLVVGGVILGVVGLVLALRRPPMAGNRPAFRHGWVLALVGSLLILSAGIGLAVVQPTVFSQDSPAGSNTPFGAIPNWCSHNPDNSFWAGCTSGSHEFEKWAPGVGWSFLLLAGVLILIGALLARRVSSVRGPPQEELNRART